jgi:hypothetical protein
VGESGFAKQRATFMDSCFHRNDGKLNGPASNA